MHKIVLLSTFFTFIFLNCEGSISEHEIGSLEENTTENQTLNELGLDIDEGKIILDFNKTTEFFKKIEIEMHGRADEIERKIEHADINLTKGLGIDFRDNQLHIDLNQTKEMLQQINILIKDILLDENNSIH